MDTEKKKVTIKVSFNLLHASLKACVEKLITTDKESFRKIDDKEKLVAFLRSDFKLGDLENIKILRKSKKHKDYIPLESENDFKSLARSLKVKNHIKLLVNDSTLAAKFCKKEFEDYKKGVAMDFSSLGKALVEASLTVLSDLRGEEFQSQANGQSKQSTQTLSSTRENSSPYKDSIHETVACDSCNPVNFVPIRGVRFKCLVCPDYDLCESCEAKQHIEKKVDGAHSFTHSMAKITRLSQESHWNCPKIFSGKNDIIYDIPLSSCSLSNKDKIETILREGGLDDFFRNVDKIIEESDKYKALASLLNNDGNQEDDEDTKFALLQSLIESSNSQVDIRNDGESSEKEVTPLEGPETSNKEDSRVASFNDKSSSFEDNEISTDFKNKVSIYTKLYEQDTRVISLILYNNSTYPIAGGDLKFEFYDANTTETILVKNVRTITPGERRNYNLGILTENFSTLSQRKLKILTSNDIVLDGDYSPGEFTSLEILNKPSLATPIYNKSEDNLIEVILVPKSNAMAQIIITNKTKTSLDCSNLKFKVVNCFDQIVCELSIIHGRKIFSKRTAKYNIGLSTAHLKYPFKLVISTDSFMASCDLSYKNLNGVFEIVPKGKMVESVSSVNDSVEEATSVISDDDAKTIDLNEKHASDNSVEGSKHFVVLPSLPKESILESNNLSVSEYADAKSFLANETASSAENHEKSKISDDDYDIISIEDGDEIASDFEVLSPASSH